MFAARNIEQRETTWTPQLEYRERPESRQPVSAEMPERQDGRFDMARLFS
jgi:hypothetical protein